ILRQSLVIRTSAFFGPWVSYYFVHAVLRTLGLGHQFEASTDVISPTYVPHLANVTLDLLIDQESGIWHLTNNDSISWIEFAKQIARSAGLDDSLIVPLQQKLPAARPEFSAMTSERGVMMPPLIAAIDDYFASVPVPVSIA